MPPKRIETWQKSATQEGKILLALNDIQNGRVKSLARRQSYTIYPTVPYTRVLKVESHALISDNLVIN
jgi:hypothetical protein